jgi:hypothetical protein
MHGCQIGTMCTILNAEQDQQYPTGFSDAPRALSPALQQPLALCEAMRSLDWAQAQSRTQTSRQTQ